VQNPYCPELPQTSQQGSNPCGQVDDLPDTLQIVSMRKGFYSSLVGESRPVLITADNELAKVAKGEGLKAVNILV
jgi:hypothetical protein